MARAPILEEGVGEGTGTDTDLGVGGPDADTSNMGEPAPEEEMPLEEEPTMDMGNSDETVVCTVVVMGDGTYKLYHGDEPEAGGAMGAPQEVTEGEAIAPPMGGEAISPGMEGEGTEGEVYDSIGDLLKGVLDCIKEHSEANGGVSDEAAMAEGFAEKDGGAPPILGV